jgi:flagellar basal-body rod modification protein FlgD
MTVQPVNSNSGAGATGQTSSTAPNPLQSLQNPNTFLNLLVAQLKYQDPLNPTSGTQFLSQTAQLTEVETMTQLQQEVSQEVTSQNQEVTSQQQQASTSMIGQTVSATLANGTTVSGIVQGVSLDTSGGPMLNVNGTSVPLGDVQSVGTAPPPGAGSGSGSGSGSGG